MFEESGKKMAFGLAKIMLLAALAALGFVFMPDGWVSGIGQGLNNAGDSVKTEAIKQYPLISARLAKEAEELKAEISDGALKLKEKANSAVSSKIKEEFNNWIDALFKNRQN